MKAVPEMELTYTQKFVYEIQGNSAVIWRCFSRTKTAEIPKIIGGYPVTALAPYAFSAHMDEGELTGKALTEDGEEGLALFGESFGESEKDCPALCGDNLEELILPETVVRVGRYCFYNCQSLKKIVFTGSLRDWGSGAFTGCHKVKHLTVSMKGEEQSTLKEVLLELPEEMCVDYIYENGGEKQYAQLIFPEFFEEGVENTPARILETHVHGSGLYYRNCFDQRLFNFAEYDSRFPYAAVQEEFRILASIVEGRLRYPYKLSVDARERYIKYMVEHKEAFGQHIVEKKDVKALKWFVEIMLEGEVTARNEERMSGVGMVSGDEKRMWAAELSEQDKRALLEKVTEFAMALRFPEGVSYLMDYQHRFFKPKKKSFDL